MELVIIVLFVVLLNDIGTLEGHFLASEAPALAVSLTLLVLKAAKLLVSYSEPVTIEWCIFRLYSAHITRLTMLKE